MKACNEIKRRIDEADDVESFDIEVARHTQACGDCRRFASERAALRELIASTARVAAPVNFEAMLQARLAEVKSRKPLAWLNAAFYLRAGAATAALVVALFVAQYSGLFVTPAPVPTHSQDPAGPSELVANAIRDQLSSPFVVPASDPSLNVEPTPVPAGSPRLPAGMHGDNGPRSRNPGTRHGSSAAPVVGAAFVDSGAMLIPGRNGERDITVPTVSVGAQSLIYSNASRQPQAARAISVSF